jgi:hypothetical protein
LSLRPALFHDHAIKVVSAGSEELFEAFEERAAMRSGRAIWSEKVIGHA